VASTGLWQGEIWNRRQDGEVFPAWLVINAVSSPDGRVANYVALLADISERKAQQQRIEHLAHHDALTNLPNRTLCRDRLALAVERATRAGSKVAVMFIDLDRFKTINDSLGHHVGDGLLQEVARRLSSCVRGGDTVSRLGGDEFLMILAVESAEEAAHVVERRILPTVRQPCDIGGTEIHVSCSIGISIFPEDGRDIDALFKNADAAMYQAKSSGRNNYQFFTEELNARAFERLNTENNLRHALHRRELALYYQPQVEARSGRVIGVEALIRWNHPDLGLISPARFIPIAEESGLIVPIGEWVMREACRQHVAWRDAGLPPIPVSVNISAVQFRQAGFADSVRAAIVGSGIDAACLELELTESIVMEDAETTIRSLERLKAMRLNLSIDDFGTGYSSLNYLRRFPIDRLKIDQSFVRDMLDDPADLAIIKAIIGLGHTLGLRVLAEGVETDEEYRALRTGGCDEMQGYAFARPMPADQLATWLEERKGKTEPVLLRVV
jgi:diguanylate cyclase (GGDEF)-like protein